jgi:hypothetical protein
MWEHSLKMLKMRGNQAREREGGRASERERENERERERERSFD